VEVRGRHGFLDFWSNSNIPFFSPFSKMSSSMRPAKHYMADVSKKLDQTLKMVSAGEYFIINRPRQYGKTTTLYSLADSLEKSEITLFLV
jgi:predicted AAA+ superfamily ATPase